MKIIGIGLLSALFAVACGGSSEPGGERQEANDDTEADDDTGEGDDDGPAGDDATSNDDDDAADDTADDSDDDTPSTDTSADDDDVAGDDTDPPDVTPPATAMPPVMTTNPPIPVPPSTGVPPMQPVPVELPEEGCETISQSTSQGSCSLSMACSTGYQSSWCNENGDGTWSCQCNAGGADKELLVTSAEAPCTMVAELCPSVEIPEFTGEETCSTQYESASTYYCQTQLRCTRGEAVNDTVSVVQSSYQTSYCSANGDALSCSCSSSTASASFGLSNVDLTSACDIGLSLCKEGAVVEQVNEETCAVSYENASDSYCSKQETCSETVLVDGTQADLTAMHTASCQTNSDGSTSCYCYGGANSYNIVLEGGTSSASCDTALAACGSDAAPALEGEPECGIASQSSSSTYCDASIACQQAATFGDTAVRLSGNLYTYCQQNGEAWQCQCQSGNEVVALDVSAETAWDACTAAAAECPNTVEPQFSSGSPCGGIAFQQMEPPADTPAAPAPIGTGAPAPSAPPGMVPCAR